MPSLLNRMLLSPALGYISPDKDKEGSKFKIKFRKLPTFCSKAKLIQSFSLYLHLLHE